jgi:SAM-dependent methyltransferase
MDEKLDVSIAVFEELIKSGKLDEIGKVVVLGCGKGHNAVLFAKAGYDVTALDFAPDAIHETRQLAKKSKVNITTHNVDLFELPGRMLNKFDFALEYVTYCSINPARRKEYLDNIQALLKPGGILIGLFFPTDKREGGPPFSVDVDELTSYLNEAFFLIHSEIPNSSAKPRLRKEILMLWKKKNFWVKK